MHIFELNGHPSEINPYLFNGDFVDWGSWSVECILTLLMWKVALPKSMYLSWGNHESRNMNKMYGFEGEVTKKYSVKFYNFFSDLFNKLPIAYLINQKVLVLHGGLFSKDGVKLDDIRKVNRFWEPGDQGILCEALWSDPTDLDGWHPSKWGIALMFGPDVS